MQIYILNQDEKVVGTLTSEAHNIMATPFFEDQYTLDLETGAETFSFQTFANSPQTKNIVVGNYVAFKFKGDFKLFRITETTDEHNEEFIVTAYCEMAGIELINEVMKPRSIASTTLKQFVTTCLMDTDWQVGSIDPNIVDVYTIELDSYGTVYSTLQNHVVNTFGGELAFRVKIDKGKVVAKYVDVFRERGTFNGFRFSYDKNIESIKRTVDTSELATALIGIGKENITFSSVSASDKPKDQDWIGDEEAYKRWNKNGNHIVGTFNYDTDSPTELLNKTREELQKRKNPKITYELSVGYEDDLGIGDTVYVVDNDFEPALHLSARVKNLTISFIDVEKGSCTLSNFKEVKSNITDEMRKLASIIDEKFPIGTNQIKDGAITSDKVEQNAINGNHIQHDTLIADHIQANQIKTNHLEANSITAEKINSGEIKTEHLQALSVTTEKLAANVVTSDKIEAGSIQTGHLTGNLIESTHIKADQIEAGHIKSDSIETDHLKANSVNTDKLQANSISTDKLQANSVNADKLQANSVTTDKLQANSINADKLQANSVTTDKLSANSVNADKIQANSIKGTHIQGEVIQGSHIMGETIEGKHLKGEIIEGTHIKGETIEGTHIKGDTISGNHIQSNSIQTGHLQANSIEASHIKSDSIGTVHLQANSINTNHLQADSVDAKKIKSESIETKHLKSEIIEADHIKSNTITANEIKGQSITGNEIKGNTITGNHIQGNTITSSHIQAGAIGSNQIQTGALTSDKMVIANGFIKDAMIDNINASKIKAGKIDTSKVTIESANGNIIIADATQQFKDKNGKVRVQIGQDSQGEFNFAVLDETGKGVLIDHTGIKEKAVSNGFIKNNMIADGQINGAKVDINSIIDKVNNDGTKTLNASKIKVDTENQTLDVSFKQMNTKIDNISVGGRNLLKDSKVNLTTNSYHMKTLYLTETLKEGDQVTLSIKGSLGTGKTAFGVYNSGGTVGLCQLNNTHKDSNGIFKTTFNWVVAGSQNQWINIYALYNSVTVDSTIEWVQLERGNKATDWKPAIEDTNSKFETLETSIGVEQGRINTLISNTTIVKDGTEMTIKDAHSKLEQKVDGFSSTVSETTTKLNNLAVGGRNLLVGTLTPKTKDVNNSTTGYTVYDPYSTHDIKSLRDLGIEVGDYVSLSFDWSIAQNGSLDFKYGDFRAEFVINKTSTYVGLIKNPVATFSASNTSGHAKMNVQINSTNIDATGIRLRIDNSVLKFTVSNMKLEKGNICTDYTVAPEDVDGKIDGIQIGGRNLIPNSCFDEDAKGWTFNNASIVTINENDFRGKNSIQFEKSDATTRLWWGANIHLTTKDDIKKDTPYVLSGWVYRYSTPANDLSLRIEIKGTRISDNASVGFANYNLSNVKADEWVYFECPMSRTDSDFRDVYVYPWIEQNGKFKVTMLKFEQATKASGWTPAPEDIETRVSSAESSIKQNAKEIALKVNVDGVKSAISLDESGVKIGGQHIDLDGQVTFKSLGSDLSELFDNEYGKTVIDGGKIKTGSISANKVNVHNLTVKDRDENVTLHITENGNVQMKGDISSYDYNERDNTGWSLNKEGNATLNNATVRGNVILPNAGITNYGDSSKGNPNLITNSTLSNGLNGWFGYNSHKDFITILPAESDKPTCKILQISRTGLTDNGWTGIFAPSTPAKKGDVFTFSVEIRIPNLSAEDKGWLFVCEALNSSGSRVQWDDVFKDRFSHEFKNNEWVRLSWTFTVTHNDTTSVALRYCLGKNGIIHYREPKIEKGSVATDWIPHVSELDSQVRFWAGADSTNREKAPFRVLQDGSIHATKGHFGGTFTGRLEIGDIVLEDTDKGYLQMNDNSGNEVIHIGEEKVYFKPTALFGDTNNNLQINTSDVIIKNKALSITSTSGNVQSTILKVNPNNPSFLELNGTHTLKTSNSTLEVIGNHTKFSNDITVVGDLATQNLVVGEMRMERKNDSGNKGIDFIFI